MTEGLNNNNNHQYSAADINRYLSGNMSPAEMHALEKAALDDPFLAEAIEGYATVNPQDRERLPAEVHRLLAEKGTGAKVIPLRRKNQWWKTAAAVFILGGGLTLTYLLTRNEDNATEKQQVAQTVSAINEATPVADSNTSQTITQSLNPTASRPAGELVIAELPGKQQNIGKSNNQLIPDPSAPAIKPDPQADQASMGNVKSTATAPELADYSRAEKIQSEIKDRDVVKAMENESVLQKKQSETAAASARKEATLNNFFTAQVVDANNMPLPFSNISVRKDNFGTYADAKGMVRLVSNDSLLNIDVKSVGYQPRTITLRSGQSQSRIVLKELDLAVREDKNAAARSAEMNSSIRRPVLQAGSTSNVEPADGWDNYNTYVANNFEIPDETLSIDKRGIVELSFNVKEDGTITDIKVNKSPGPAFEEAAIRLLREGPQWKIKKGSKRMASVKLQF